MNKRLRFNLPITKVDQEQRIVSGYATVEEIDSQGEIIEYEASKKAFSAWIGNIREQHNPEKAVGKALNVRFDDDRKGIWLDAYISESTDGENAWIKIKEGVLTGFSIGGVVNDTKVERAIIGGEPQDVVHITDYDLMETSVVDNPALGVSAQFAVVKSVDGKLVHTEEMQEGGSMPYWLTKYSYLFSNMIEKNDIEYNNSSKGVNLMAKEEVKKEEVIEEATEEVTEEVVADEAVEEVTEEVKEEGEAEAVEEEVVEEKSAKAEDIKKSTKVSESIKKAEFGKLADKVGELEKELVKVGDLVKSIDDLKGQVETLSKTAQSAKSAASYVEVDKVEKSDDVRDEYKSLVKQAEELDSLDPQRAVIAEKMLKLRKQFN